MVIKIFLFLVVADVEDAVTSLVLVIVIMNLLSFMMIIYSDVVFMLAFKVVIELVYNVRSVIFITVYQRRRLLVRFRNRRRKEKQLMTRTFYLLRTVCISLSSLAASGETYSKSIFVNAAAVSAAYSCQMSFL